MAAIYDTIGVDYANLRQPDRRIAAQIDAALGPARTVLNVGAGAGSYEPPDRAVMAVEPSLEMVRQRPPAAAPVVQASAESLPFADDSFDAAAGLARLEDDLGSGRWTDRYGHLLALDAIDAGYRLVKTTSSQASTAAVGV